jgi:hypothetical protein
MTFGTIDIQVTEVSNFHDQAMEKSRVKFFHVFSMVQLLNLTNRVLLIRCRVFFFSQFPIEFLILSHIC